MSRLFENIRDGAATGLIIGGALDILMIGTATVVGGPVGLAAALATTTAATGTCAAAGTVIGGGVGVVETFREEKEGG